MLQILPLDFLTFLFLDFFLTFKSSQFFRSERLKTTKSTTLSLDLDLEVQPLLEEKDQPETMNKNINIIGTAECARFILYDRNMVVLEKDKNIKRFVSKILKIYFFSKSIQSRRSSPHLVSIPSSIKKEVQDVYESPISATKSPDKKSSS
ncbi:hypothetical protein ACQ4LE_003742, partial [Meloidogyne hapla]